MATSKILITPVSNIRDYAVVDSKLITEEAHDSRMATFTFYNVRSKVSRSSHLMEVSIFDDEIVREDGNYKILHMLTT